MKRDRATTGRERLFPAEQKLISTTDLKGVITYANQAFIDISGYGEEELVGHSHNIVRHPDMPAAAFKVMWDYLQDGKPWMGVVKNRCKNGDHYWVNAYVTPIFEEGQLIGYESVRTMPERNDIARAEYLYSQVKAGKNLPKNYAPVIEGIIVVALITLVMTLYVLDFSNLSLLIAVCAGLTAFVYGKVVRNGILNRIEQSLSSGFCHPLTAAVISPERADEARLHSKLRSHQARLETVMTRVLDAAQRVSDESNLGLKLSSDASQFMLQQQQETEQVATAMNEMTSTILEVSSHIQSTAEKSSEVNTLVSHGMNVATTAKSAIENLDDSVNDISDAVTDLSEQTSLIIDAAQIIEQIAEQTNLLALNAAIEAARAGEQGRGFAVVADEIRKLAQRTQGSTQDIHEIVKKLTVTVTESEGMAKTGRKDALAGMEKVAEAERVLSEIQMSVVTINDMTHQIATAVEEQTFVSEGINKQVTNISDLANDTLDTGTKAAEGVVQLSKVAVSLQDLVVRFGRQLDDKKRM
ncbi:methyl-accepting chemotaxis protein [Echinimonas agarilytica]|uniref:Methyl-accepting chemotaxis protein n=1 Tax=Echinimonas agarilytica TaxID=1215918 RepID=A0AA41W642_9GAMM|nr:PAS domain-containing methyl-accepting chemotaxis protein [Echinimonas agarilytica]MCM2679291.1 methyl-accepting chemotaxis protein [Echinimonas agarilytica]